jgi:hypothetical protein
MSYWNARPNEDKVSVTVPLDTLVNDIGWIVNHKTRKKVLKLIKHIKNYELVVNTNSYLLSTSIYDSYLWDKVTNTITMRLSPTFLELLNGEHTVIKSRPKSIGKYPDIKREKTIMALNLLQAKQQMVHADGTPKLAKAISKEELVGYLELQEEKPNTINTTLKRVFNDIAEHFGILYKYDRSRGVYEQTDFQTVGGKKIQGSPKGRGHIVLDVNGYDY